MGSILLKTLCFVKSQFTLSHLAETASRPISQNIDLRHCDSQLDQLGWLGLIRLSKNRSAKVLR